MDINPITRREEDHPRKLPEMALSILGWVSLASAIGEIRMLNACLFSCLFVCLLTSDLLFCLFLIKIFHMKREPKSDFACFSNTSFLFFGCLFLSCVYLRSNGRTKVRFWLFLKNILFVFFLLHSICLVVIHVSLFCRASPGKPNRN